MHKLTSEASLAHAPSLMVQMVLCALAVVSLLYVPVPIMSQLARNYGLAPEIAGYALGAFGVAYALGFLVFGPLSDRIGRKKVMAGGLLALAAVSIGLALVSTPALFLVGRALQGFAAASFPPVALAYLAEGGTPRQRMWGMAWMSTAFLSAGLLGQIYGATAAARWGFGWALMPLVAIYVATALRISVAPETALRAPASLWDGYRPLAGLVRDPKLRRVYAPAFLLLMSFVAFYIGLDTHLGSVMEEQGISRLLSREIALPAFLAPLLVATSIPRWGAHRVASFGLAVTTLGLAMSAMAGGDHVRLLLAASAIFVAGVGISVPGLIARVASVAPPSARGLAVSFYTFVLFMGASLGPSLARLGAGWSEQAFFLMLAGCIGVAALYSAVEARPTAARTA
ncbi:MFS transporter [Variovorax sp. M-6]|uniref:MFS transporter n=1 Tax=Variovorax sp. M-6 TaxID=3233041 RepID=UPI003F979E2C